MNLEWLVFPNNVHFFYLIYNRGHENIPAKCTFPFTVCLVFRVIPVVYFSKVSTYINPDVKVFVQRMNLRGFLFLNSDVDKIFV